MQAGAEDLEQWMLDAIRQGLATLDRSPEEWELVTSRMIDAKMKGLSLQLKKLSTYRAEDWPGQLLQSFGRLYTLTRGLQQFDSLPEALKNQLLAEAGVTTTRKTLLEKAGTTDHWLVLSCWQGLNIDKAAMQKTWLRGLTNHHLALLLEYDYTGQGFETNFQTGQILEGELVFYSESLPVRALLKKWKPSSTQEATLEGYPTIDSLLDAYAATLVQNPWTVRFASLLENVQIAREGSQFLLIDEQKKMVPAKIADLAGWTLLSIGSGQPVTVFGEWDGAFFHPLSVFAGRRFVDLGKLISDTTGAKRFRRF